MGARPAGPLPEDIVEWLMTELPEYLKPEDAFAIERLVEFAYATGYAGGHVRGWQGGRADERRRARQATDKPVAAGAFPQAAAS
jgi:hypothetical protein